MPYGLIIYAKIKTQRASKDVPEPVGSPAVIEKSMVSNLPLRVVPSLHSYHLRRDCHGQSKWQTDSIF